MLAWAGFVCSARSVAGRRGWRRPTLSELSTLLDTAESQPALPPGDPFEGVEGWIWTAAESRSSPTTHGLALDLDNGSVIFADKSFQLRFWCVRGPGGADGH